MKTSWHEETGQLTLHWCGVGERILFDTSFAQETSSAQGSYLPPLPDFASHSPFGGPSWFQPDLTLDRP
ncbi:MAG TPA: hypothetical protein VGG59_08850 [Acidobacteriaceae bacterium]|jgi:hypothetical protein